MTRPKSAFRASAAARGPGVGGINTWETYRPVESATANTTNEIPVFLLKALLMEERIINPASQKTGIEIKNPVKFMAKGDFLSPKRPTTYLAKADVAPDFSKNVPIIAPSAIIIPILDSVFPKPSFILSIMELVSNPIRNPEIIDVRTSVIKGCILNLVMAITIKMMAKNIIKNICITQGLKKK